MSLPKNGDIVGLTGFLLRLIVNLGFLSANIDFVMVK